MKGNANICETVDAMLVNDVAVLAIAHPALRCVLFFSFPFFYGIRFYQALKETFISFCRLVIGSSDVATINVFHHATGTL